MAPFCAADVPACKEVAVCADVVEAVANGSEEVFCRAGTLSEHTDCVARFGLQSFLPGDSQPRSPISISEPDVDALSVSDVTVDLCIGPLVLDVAAETSVQSAVPDPYWSTFRASLSPRVGALLTASCIVDLNPRYRACDPRLDLQKYFDLHVTFDIGRYL